MNENTKAMTDDAERCTNCGQMFPAKNPADRSALRREHTCRVDAEEEDDDENPYRFQPKTGLPATK